MEIRSSFRQFSTWRFPLKSMFRVVSVILSALVRLLLGRSLKYSYAFAGEDRIIEGLLMPRITEPGFYVDVGTNHPKLFPNTYGLYRKGWGGICIDIGGSIPLYTDPGTRQLLLWCQMIWQREISIKSRTMCSPQRRRISWKITVRKGLPLSCDPISPAH